MVISKEIVFDSLKNKNTEPSLLIIDQNGVIGSILASQLFKNVRLEHASVLSSDISLDMNADMKMNMKMNMKVKVKKDDVLNTQEKVKVKDEKYDTRKIENMSDYDNKNDDNDGERKSEKERSRESSRENDDLTDSVGESIVVADEKVI